MLWRVPWCARVRVVIALPHARLREAVSTALHLTPAILVVAQTVDVGRAIESARATRPDVVLLGTSLLAGDVAEGRRDRPRAGRRSPGHGRSRGQRRVRDRRHGRRRRRVRPAARRRGHIGTGTPMRRVNAPVATWKASGRPCARPTLWWRSRRIHSLAQCLIRRWMSRACGGCSTLAVLLSPNSTPTRSCARFSTPRAN